MFLLIPISFQAKTPKMKFPKLDHGDGASTKGLFAVFVSLLIFVLWIIGVKQKSLKNNIPENLFYTSILP